MYYYYLQKVFGKGYPENLTGQAVNQPLIGNEAIDTVSGATRSTNGILMAVEKGMYQVGQNQLGLAVPDLKIFHLQWKDGLVVLLLILVMLAATLNMRKLRPWKLQVTNRLQCSLTEVAIRLNGSLWVRSHTSLSIFDKIGKINCASHFYIPRISLIMIISASTPFIFFR